jgi:pyridoxamine 5'-phosphate oxidase
MDIQFLRKEYKLKKLNRSSLDSCPFKQFNIWWQEALSAEELEPNAMALATANPKNCRPSCRMVLMKSFNEKGILFFTNLESRKSTEIEANPQAEALFWWRALERQVRIEGNVEKASQKETEEYFSKRPRKSQLGSLASRQDTIIESRASLENELQKLEEQFKEKPIPVPAYWGGYWLIPQAFEFWQGREDRLHDRFRYLKTEEGWTIDRISP